jgi:hypothetical protein
MLNSLGFMLRHKGENNMENKSAVQEAAQYEQLGLTLATLLLLKKKRSNGRYDTLWGDKSAEGLGRTVARMVREELQ